VVPEDAKDFLVTKGYDPQYGARPLRRTIQNLIEDPLAEFLLQGKFQPGDVVHAIAKDGTIVLEQGEHPDGLKLPPPPEAALSAGGSTGGSEPGSAEPNR
jgi:ATP-dependent Clp protease ATP-binding subunit ClpC